MFDLTIGIELLRHKYLNSICDNFFLGGYPPPVYAGPNTESQQPETMSNNGMCTYPPVMNSDKVQHMAGDHLSGSAPPFMGWEGGEGMTYSYQGYDPGYPPVVVNNGPVQNGNHDQHGVTVTMCPTGQTGDQAQNGQRGQHTVHFHVHQGEAVSLQLGEQVQMIQA